MRSEGMLFAEERRRKILEMIKNGKKVIVSDLSGYFGVSGATVRNDLRELDTIGLLTRTHGGAIMRRSSVFEPETKQKEGRFLIEKKMIAQAAINLIDDGDTVILDAGTTTLEIAKLLNVKKNITVVASDIRIVKCLEDTGEARIVLVGGVLRRNCHCTTGGWGVKMLSGLSVNKAFIAVNGISAGKGLSTPDLNLAEMKRAMIEAADSVIVVCDSSKVGKNAFAQFADIGQADVLITDRGISKSDTEEFKTAGIDVIIAGC